MQSSYAYNDVLQDNYTFTDTTHLYDGYMFVSPLTPDDYEALLADMRLTEPSYATATDGVGARMLPYQPQPGPPCYHHVTSVEMDSVIPYHSRLSTQPERTI
jgi:hypothetical protein